jgi:large subunit ribosomal protein L29
MKVSELRQMSDEQLAQVLKETRDALFRLRVRAQTERLDAPSEVRKMKKLIARILTIQNERKRAQEKLATQAG